MNPKTEKPDKVMCGLLVSSTQMLAVFVKHPSKKKKKLFCLKKEKKKCFHQTIRGCN